MGIPEGMMRLRIITIIYILFITLVPNNPSYYRLFVDTVGAVLSLLCLFFLELYLNSRPVHQRTVLHGQAHLILYLHLVFAMHCWLVSVGGSLFPDIILMFMKCFPRLFILMVASSPYLLSMATAYCTVAVSKILLLLSPATFHNLSTRIGFWTSAIAALLVPLIGGILNQIKCEVFTKKLVDTFRQRRLIKYALGISNRTHERAEGNITIDTGGSKDSSEEDKDCSTVPVLAIVWTLLIGLELVKLIMASIIEVKKITARRKHVNKVMPALELADMGPKDETKAEVVENISHTNEGPVEADDKTSSGNQEIAIPDVKQSFNNKKVTMAFEKVSSTNQGSVQDTSSAADEISVISIQVDVATSAKNKNAFPSKISTATITNLTGVEIDVSIIDKEEIISTNKGMPMTVEEISPTKKYMPATIVEMSLQVEGISSTREETTGTVEEISSSTEEIAVADKEVSRDVEIVVSNIELKQADGTDISNVPSPPSKKTVAGTLISTMRSTLLRAGSLSLVICLVFIVARCSIYMTKKDMELSLFPQLMLVLVRYMAYLVPLVCILFETDVRVYTLLKIKRLYQKYVSS